MVRPRWSAPVSGRLPINDDPVTIGSTAEGLYMLDGDVDEVRICGEALSADWIRTSYANENEPALFLSVGPQE